MTDPPSTSARRRARTRWLVVALLGLSLALNLVPAWWGLPGARWAVDEIRPEQVEGGRPWPDKYPPAHRLLLRAFVPLVDALAAAGIVDAEGLDRHTALLLVARLLSVLMSTATVWCVYRAGRRLFGREASLLAALALALSPSFVYYAKTANLEAPYLFWFALSLNFYLAALRRHRLRDYLLFAATATLAVATKDQAFALYLLSPLFVVAALWRRRRDEPGERGAPAATLATLLDRRVLLAFAAPFALTALVWAVASDFETMWRHFQFIAGPAPAKYREFEPTLTGQGAMAIRALANATFALGLPLSLAAVFGIARALRRPAENVKLLGLAAIALGYYLGFIAVIGYHYARFFLPVAVLLALPAGKALADLAAARWCPRPAARAAVAAVFAWCLLRALAVDVAMAGDSRYAAERWLEASPSGARVTGLGNGSLLPRRLRVVSWASAQRGGCRGLEDLDARLLAVNASAARGRPEAAFVAALERGELGYDLAVRHPRGRALGLLGVDRVDTNLDRIDPEILIFRRGSGRCRDEGTLLEMIESVRAATERPERGGPALLEARRELARSLAAGERGSVELGRARAAGLSPDGWTRGTAAAALWIRNRQSSPAAPRLALVCGAPPDGRPPAVRIDDGGTPAGALCERPGPLRVRLAELAPGEERLVLVWAETAWQPGGRDRRWLGVQVARFDLAGAERGDGDR